MPYQRLLYLSDDKNTSDTENILVAKTDVLRPKLRAKKLRLITGFLLTLSFTVLFGMRPLRLSPSRLSLDLLRPACYRNVSMKSGSSTLPSHFDLPSGDRIPSIALGVWKAGKGEVGAAIKTALKAGYRHIDDAWIYRNEPEVGQAIKESGVVRSDLWLTSKLWNSFHAPEDIEQSLDESLRNLGTDYLDLYLIHWPIAFKKEKGPNGENVYDPQLSEDSYPTWQKLEEMVEKGKVRNIGLSNFNIRRIQNLTSNPLKIKPAVLQVELNFWNPQPELVKWARDNELPVQSYSPLGGNKQVKHTLQVPQIKRIAEELGLTPAQVVNSWHVQRGTIVLPKSITPSRIEENLHVSVLPDDLFAELEAVSASHEPKRTVNPSKEWGLDFDIFDD